VKKLGVAVTEATASLYLLRMLQKKSEGRASRTCSSAPRSRCEPVAESGC
jgi:hypothetical protein